VSAPYAIGFRSVEAEPPDAELTVEGRLPAWLRGRLLRTGPALFEVGRQAYRHWFDGLAMLHSVAFLDDGVHYRGRFLRSEAFCDALDAGAPRRAEFGTLPHRGPLGWLWHVVDPMPPTDNGNVNVARLAGSDVALTESPKPVVIGRRTLQTGGHLDRSSVTGQVSTAHPHLDPVRGCAFNYVVEFGSQSRYRLFRTDRDGSESVIVDIPVDEPAYMHSFGMTERFLVLTEFPLVVNPLRLRFGGVPFIEAYRWRPERGTRITVVDKERGTIVRQATAAARFGFHHVNAFEEGDDIVVDLVGFEDAAVIDALYLDALRSAEPSDTAGRLLRYRLGPAGGDVEEQWLDDQRIELPRIHPALQARAHRFVYAAATHTPGNFLDAIAKIDLAGERGAVWHDERLFPGEPIFVPAPDADDEDNGVVLSLALDTASERSVLLVLDGALSELARMSLPLRVPFGFHGQWLED